MKGIDLRGLGDQFGGWGRSRVGTRRLAWIIVSLSKTWNTRRKPRLGEANKKTRALFWTGGGVCETSGKKNLGHG